MHDIALFCRDRNAPGPLLHDIHLLKTPPTDAIYGKLRFFLCVL
ncbi:hypothetical protein SEEA9225_21124 [Salmonella enterica subsp. enterica serovar Agona str. 442692 2-5]|nr:hypothetical protein SEEA9225_21124 [Salmonella enterica subsp. enterica serovar Agona str. 442692 2-5]